MLLNKPVPLTNCFITAAVLALAAFLVFPAPTQAMHIAEGILPFNWAVIWSLAAAAFVGAGIWLVNRRVRHDRGFMPLLGLTGAAIFLISCIPIPVPLAGTCSHPCGSPLGSILVGPFISAFLSSVALLMQALFMAHGGLTTWGANTVSMGVVGSFAGYGSFLLFRSFKAPIFLAAFAAGLLGDWATYTATSLELSLALSAGGDIWPMFTAILAAFSPTQIPLGILEGLFTGGVASLLSHRRPELFRLLHNNGSAAPAAPQGGGI
jgi:cobalt/nickel transport system permease protein